MSTTKERLGEWFDRGVEEYYDFMFVVTDTFDYQDYPLYCRRVSFEKERERIMSAPLQQITEIYNLAMDREAQLSEHRCFNTPLIQ